MSRCFPFPPPGYEKKPRSTEHGDLLAKEHKEKKHKKEKDRERKDKDKRKDKHKEKKERKEKHRDKKKDKRRDKEKINAPVDQKTETDHEDKLVYDSHKTEEVGDSKFTKELERRIRDEHGATNHMVEDISSTANKRIEITGTSTAMVNKVPTNVASQRNEKLTPSFHKRTEAMHIATTMEMQKFISSEKVHDFTSTEQRRTEHRNPKAQKRIDSMGNAAAMEKQRATNNHKLGDFANLVERKAENMFAVNSIQKGRITGNNLASNTIGASTKGNDQAAENHATAMSKQRATNNHKIGDSTNLVERRAGSIFTVNSIQKERITSSNLASNTIGASTKRNDQAAENHTSIPRRNESISGVPATEKEGFMFASVIGARQGRAEGMGLPVEKGADNKTEGIETSKEKAEDGNKEGHKDRERNEKKRKEKDNDRDKEKKKEKKRGKREHKHSRHDKLKGCEIKDQIQSLNHKILSPHMENINASGAEKPNKKRKEFEGNPAGIDGSKDFESNGFHDSQQDGPPNKQPRTSAASSHPLVENGRLLESALMCSPIKLGGVNTTKVERGSNNNEKHINVKVEVQPSPVPKPPIPAGTDSSKSNRVPSKPPHPDNKYLSIIYNIPKIEELSEFDDQDWLFNDKKPPSNTIVEADGTPPQVGAKGLQIESADVFALPYVIPF